MAGTGPPQVTTSALAAPEVRPLPAASSSPKAPANGPRHLTVLPEWLPLLLEQLTRRQGQLWLAVDTLSSEERRISGWQ